MGARLNSRKLRLGAKWLGVLGKGVLSTIKAFLFKVYHRSLESRVAVVEKYKERYHPGRLRIVEAASALEQSIARATPERSAFCVILTDWS